MKRFFMPGLMTLALAAASCGAPSVEFSTSITFTVTGVDYTNPNPAGDGGQQDGGVVNTTAPELTITLTRRLNQGEPNEQLFTVSKTTVKGAVSFTGGKALSADAGMSDNLIPGAYDVQYGAPPAGWEFAAPSPPKVEAVENGETKVELALRSTDVTPPPDGGAPDTGTIPSGLLKGKVRVEVVDSVFVPDAGQVGIKGATVTVLNGGSTFDGKPFTTVDDGTKLIEGLPLGERPPLGQGNGLQFRVDAVGYRSKLHEIRPLVAEIDVETPYPLRVVLEKM